MANLFLIDNQDQVFTAGPEEGILPGVTRGRVIALLQNLGYPVFESGLKAGEAKALKAAFITNSLLGVKPVSALDEWVFDAAESRYIQRMYADWRLKYEV